MNRKNKTAEQIVSDFAFRTPKQKADRGVALLNEAFCQAMTSGDWKQVSDVLQVASLVEGKIEDFVSALALACGTYQQVFGFEGDKRDDSKVA